MLVLNTCLRGIDSIDKAEMVIKAILSPLEAGLPTALEMAFSHSVSRARTYLAIVAGGVGGFTLLYDLQRADQELRPDSPIRARIVAFGGEVCAKGTTPDVFVIEGEETTLLDRLYLPRVSVMETFRAYEVDCDGDYAHTFVLDPTVEDQKSRPTTRMMPIPLEWAPMFVDNPDFGTTIGRMKDLFMSVNADKRRRLVDILSMMTMVCCSASEDTNAESTLATDWHMLTYHASTRRWAEEK